MVPKPKHRVTFLSQPGFPFCILSYLGVMLTAIHFDDQSLLQANEIHHVRTYRPLSPELMPAYLTETKVLPKKPLGSCRIRA
jgi:hypothetical protein